ncbi:MAG TPA: O-antigen ligase family protein [Longimicrobiales bacterium]
MRTLALTAPSSRSFRQQSGAAALALAAIAVSFGIVHHPWAVIGVVAGGIVLAVAVAAPLALVAFTLMLGCVDLSFMTGGFKALLTQMGGLDMNGIRLVGATAGFAVYILNAPAGRNAIVGRQALPYVVFLTYAFGTLANSLDALEGARLFLKLMYPLLTLLLVVGLCDTREKLEKLANYLLIAGALIIFVVTPLAMLQGGYEVDYAGFRRVRGVAGGASTFSFYLMMVLLFAFSRFVFRRQIRYLILCAGAAGWIMMTYARITFLATLIGLAVITLLSAFTQKQYKAFAGGLLVALMVAVPGLPFVLERSLGFVPSPGELAALVSNPIALYESINWQGRTYFWPIVWTGFMAAPVFGLGLGSSGAVIRQHFPSDAAPMAHNEYLRLAADTGIIGVGLFTLAMLVWLGSALRAAIRESRAVAEYATPAAAGVIAWGVVAVTDNPFDYYMYFTQYVGFLMGGILALRSIAAREQHADRRLS